MNWDDVVYALLLVVSIALGPVLRKVTCPRSRQWASAAAGFVIVWLVSGWHVMHPIVLILINSVITFFISKKVNHIWSFVFCFSYLAFFRMCHWFGLPSPPPYTNAIQMILTIKMVGLTYEVKDSFERRFSSDAGNSLQFKYQNISPSFVDVFLYSFCHAGVLTGPYYKYRIYWDSFYLPFSVTTDFWPHFFSKSRNLPFFIILYIVGGSFFPLEYAESEEMGLRSIWYRLWYMTPLFFVFRMRMYSGFILSELQCVTAGLGIYPVACKSKSGQGPSNYEPLENGGKIVEYDYETIHNIDAYGSDFTPTVKEAMRCWNMTVQYWLAMFVYKQVPQKTFGVAATMLASSFWHGIYPGYYLSLLTVPFVLMAEDSMARALRRDATPQGQRLFDWISWFFKMQAFSYMGMGFYLLRVDATLNFWKSIYFLGHILIVIFFVMGRFIVKMKRKRVQSGEKKQS